MSKKVNPNKRVRTDRFLKTLNVFLRDSLNVLDGIDPKEPPKSIDENFLDFYLIHSDEFSRNEFEDNIKLCSALDYLIHLNTSQAILNYKTISVKKVLSYSRANIISDYEFHEKKFKNWQKRLLKILTFEELI